MPSEPPKIRGSKDSACARVVDGGQSMVAVPCQQLLSYLSSQRLGAIWC
jgi:hypothetical protein